LFERSSERLACCVAALDAGRPLRSRLFDDWCSRYITFVEQS
jgi:hypothetical protein